MFLLLYPSRPGWRKQKKDGFDQRRSSIQVVELKLQDGWIIADRDKSSFIQMSKLWQQSIGRVQLYGSILKNAFIILIQRTIVLVVTIITTSFFRYIQNSVLKLQEKEKQFQPAMLRSKRNLIGSKGNESRSSPTTRGSSRTVS